MPPRDLGAKARRLRLATLLFVAATALMLPAALGDDGGPAAWAATGFCALAAVLNGVAAVRTGGGPRG